jgi:hypothetical protein
MFPLAVMLTVLIVEFVNVSRVVETFEYPGTSTPPP